MKYVEETIHTSALPTNTLPILGRLIEVLKEIGTNSLIIKEAKEDKRVNELMWLLNMQFHGEMATIDQYDEYCKIRDREKAEQQQMNEDSQLDSMIEDKALSDMDIHFG